jgi:hypothetical protein
LNRPDCERLHELGPEIALGIADGEDRAWALDHLADCPACRTRIERLSALADELLMLAPAAEPPAGFEGRVAEAIAPAPRGAKAPRRRRLLIGATAALAAAACSAAAVWVALGNDRELADSYRSSLAVANGEYFDAAPIEAPGGQKVGYVYGYQGQTSWVLALIYDGVAPGRYELQLVTSSGERMPLRSLEVSDGKGSAGSATPIPYEDLSEVRLLDSHGREVAESILRD